jgi:UDP-N-acetylmuramoylalanine--D-glutamate ligase
MKQEAECAQADFQGNTPPYVVILGLARQGKALARFFAEQGAHVTVSDQRSAEALQPAIQALEDLPIRYVLGEHPLSLLDVGSGRSCDLLCLSGGVPIELPVVQEAMRRGIPLSNDAQEFLRRCPSPVIGITGSAGKTTTTALVGEMLKASGQKTWIGGNIGNPLISDLAAIHREDRIVMELSSFQLELMHMSPQIAGVLNITPNHLDRHGTMEAYIAAKANIVVHQRHDPNNPSVAVLSYDDPNARALATRTPARIRYFSGEREVADGAFLRRRDAALMLRDGNYALRVCQRDALRLRGFHNVLNVLAAITLADAADVHVEAMRAAIMTFTGVAHRLEEVRRCHGVLWVNDSIATAPERVLAALDSFEEPLVLLAGGRDKDLPWDTYARRVVERVRVLVLFGEASALIEEHVARARAGQRDGVSNHNAPDKGSLEAIMHAGTLERAVEIAAQQVRPGEVVLLSPGGTSFDAFQDFAERGEYFRELVMEL